MVLSTATTRVLATLILLAVLLPIVGATPVFGEAEEVELPEFVAKALSDPKALVAILIQFLMGLALGYFAVKVIKYLIALIAILIVGSVLSVWSIGGSIEEFLTRVAGTASAMWPVIYGALVTLGIMTVAPITAGFILGAVIAFVRK